MDERQIRKAVVPVFVTTTIWVLLMLIDISRFGEPSSIGEVLSYASRRDILFFLTYLNAALITLSIPFLFAGFYIRYKEQYPIASTASILFIPVYCLLNLIVYLAQIAIVPKILRIGATVPENSTTDILAALFTQVWPGSGIMVLNYLAYAILGIPSIVFGYYLSREAGAGKWAGRLLSGNGIACVIGFAGIIPGNRFLILFNPIGGLLFLASLMLMWFHFKEKGIQGSPGIR